MGARVWLAAIVLALFVWERPAQAYLDPGSGSMLLQVILGGVAAAGVALRFFWSRLFGGLRRRSQDDSQ